MSRLLVLVIAVAITGIGGYAQSRTALPAPADEEILHVLNRLTYGPRPGDVERVRSIGVRTWIDQQLSPARIDDSALQARLATFETLALDPQVIQRDYAGPAMAERRQRQLANTSDRDMAPGSSVPASGAPPAEPRSGPSDAQRKARLIVSDLEQAKLLRAVQSERQLEELLVDFWFNHFNVNAGKGVTRNYVASYERDAIRPHVLGSFREMLGASARHPAMLFYLDNWQSKAGRINENFARELLELHTLGVDGGYTQDDIVQVARALTGWTMRPRQGSGFVFAAALHDRGDKKILGHTIRGGGVDEGDRVLDIIAAHPSTARHIARKLAIRFVSDEPPPALVDRAAAAFTSTKGDLRAVTRLILTSNEFFSTGVRRSKVKTPLEFVASALRATSADLRNGMPLTRTLRDMGMPLYSCQPPTGYDETATAWVSAGALVSRMNFAVEIAKNQVRGVRVPLTEEQTLALKIGAPEFQRQ